MNIIGFIDRIDGSGVRGWAYAPDASDAHLDVTATLDECVIGKGRADQMRSDLRSLGFGDGHHGFAIGFDIAVAPENHDAVEIYVSLPDGERIRLPRAKEDKRAAPPESLTAVPQPASDTSHRPVFVLGAARSGTSAMAQGLLKSGAFKGFEEGHYLWMLSRILLTIRHYYEDNGDDSLPDRFTLLSRVPAQYPISGMRAMFVQSMATLYPDGRWLDKTPRPEMIEAARLMQELWPNARFVFMKRRALENVSSRMTKFPTISFRDHCKDWSLSMRAWLLVRDLLGGAAIEVEQLAVAREPERVAAEIGAFLELSGAEVQRLARAFADDRPELTTKTFAPVMRIDQMGWSKKQIATFRQICGPMMGAYGYSYTGDYFAKPMRQITTERVAE